MSWPDGDGRFLRPGFGVATMLLTTRIVATLFMALYRSAGQQQERESRSIGQRWRSAGISP
jgi:hypothetical protein